jgi:hypothetical protein
MNMPTVTQNIDYRRILQEKPLIGSRFTARGGYATPGGIVICRALQNKVRALQEEYAEEARLQRARGSLVQFKEPQRTAQPLLESEYIDPGSRPGLHHLPTPNPSQSDFLN